MPWKLNQLRAAKAGLRDAAISGQFVPGKWIADIQHKDGGYTVLGCGWGLVGWYVAVMIGGADWAKRQLPIGVTQQRVNEILAYAGLTPAEIESMAPQTTYTAFDTGLSFSYRNRFADPSQFLTKSIQLAEFFIKVLEQVPCSNEEEVEFPYAVMNNKLPTLVLESQIEPALT